MFGPDLKDPAILRDLFAVVILGFEELGLRYVPMSGPEPSLIDKADKAYLLADAMLAARKVKK
jgi:hypothetical protein